MSDEGRTDPFFVGIKKAIIPAAGLGRQWTPLSLYIPKEMLPVGNYPLIHSVLDEAHRAGCTEIVMIYRKGKEILRRYVEKEWQQDNPDIYIHWLLQPKPKGVGDAILCALDFLRTKEPVFILYPDVFHPVHGGISYLSECYLKHPAPWIGLVKRQFKQHQASLSGKIVRGSKKKFQDRVYQVHYARSGERIIGYGAGRFIMPGLDHLRSSVIRETVSGEIDDNILFDHLWESGVYAVQLPLPIVDCGSPFNYRYKYPD
jgi:UTP-glucose-1-phosphate uridylyltransferase